MGGLLAARRKPCVSMVDTRALAGGTSQWWGRKARLRPALSPPCPSQWLRGWLTNLCARPERTMCAGAADLACGQLKPPRAVRSWRVQLNGG